MREHVSQGDHSQGTLVKENSVNGETTAQHGKCNIGKATRGLIKAKSGPGQVENWGQTSPGHDREDIRKKL